MRYFVLLSGEKTKPIKANRRPLAGNTNNMNGCELTAQANNSYYALHFVYSENSG
jgi:hypothetical protein